MGTKTVSIAALGLYTDGVRILTTKNGVSVADFKKCDSTTEIPAAIHELFVKSGLTSGAHVRVMIDSSYSTTLLLPRKKDLTDEELCGIAMNHDLESLVTENISTYTWDFYEAKTARSSQQMLNFVLVPKELIRSIVDAVGSCGYLESITIADLALTEFISVYQYCTKNNVSPIETTMQNAVYPAQLCIVLYMPKDSELMVFGIFQGELCYSRVMRGYKSLVNGLISGEDDPVVSRLTTELLRLNDDFFTSQLNLPPMSKLLLIIQSDQLGSIAEILGKNFPRSVDVIPGTNINLVEKSNNYSVCKINEFNDVAAKGLEFIPLFGLLKEGLLESEKD